MKRLVSILLFCVLLLSLLASGCGGGATQTPPVVAEPPTELILSAAISLKDALAEIKTNYEQKNPRIKLLYNLGASGTLQKQIEQGAPVDLFISAAPRQMDELEVKGLLHKASRKNLVENKMVLIMPQKATSRVEKFEDLTQAAVQKVAIGEPSVVPAGQYAVQVLKKLGIWDQVKGKSVLAKDARAVLTYVETGNVEAGIVYKTDAASSSKVKVVATAPEGSHAPILYPVAVLAGTKQQKAANDFLAYLSSPEAEEVFVRHGFNPLANK